MVICMAFTAACGDGPDGYVTGRPRYVTLTICGRRTPCEVRYGMRGRHRMLVCTFGQGYVRQFKAFHDPDCPGCRHDK